MSSRTDTATSNRDLKLAGNSALSRLGWLRLLVWVVLLVALVPRLADFFAHSFEVLAWKWQIDYDEGLNLSASWHLSQGHNIYANSTPEHFIAAPYPPLYFILNAIILKIFGVTLLGGRLLTFGASLLIGFLIGLNVRTVARRAGVGAIEASGAGIFAGLVWLCVPPVYVWSTFFKQDMVAIAVALIGLTLVYRWQDSRKLYLAAPVLALGFFAKQNELSAVGVAGLYIVWRELLQGEGERLRPNWKRALFFGLSLAGWVLIPFGLLNFITKNGYYNHIIGYQLVPWNFDDLARRVGRVINDHPVLLALAALYLLIGLAIIVQKWQKAESWSGRLLALRPGLFPIYMLAATASLFTVGAYQGNYNLVLDLFPPLLVLGGVALAWTVNKGFAQLADFVESSGLGRGNPAPTEVDLVGGTSRNSLLSVALLLLVVAGALWQCFTFVNPERTYYFYGSMPGVERRGLMERLEKDIQQAPGDFLTEDVYLPLSQGRNVPYDNLYHMRLQSEEGKWDDSKFLQDLRDRRFGLVLLEHNARRWSDRGWQTLNENYELVFPEGIDLWRPRARPLTPQNRLANCTLAQGQDQLSFLGYSFGPSPVALHPGDGLTLTTYWKVAAPVKSNYTLFVHLINEKGELVAQRDAEPDRLDLNVKPGEPNPATPAPTSSWQSGSSALTIDQSLPLPRNLAPGSYTVLLGAYRPGPNALESMQPACPNLTGTALNLGQVKVEG
jgi:hypothetical protein